MPAQPHTSDDDKARLTGGHKLLNDNLESLRVSLLPSFWDGKEEAPLGCRVPGPATSFVLSAISQLTGTVIPLLPPPARPL